MKSAVALSRPASMSSRRVVNALLVAFLALFPGAAFLALGFVTAEEFDLWVRPDSMVR